MSGAARIPVNYGPSSPPVMALQERGEESRGNRERGGKRKEPRECEIKDGRGEGNERMGEKRGK